MTKALLAYTTICDGEEARKLAHLLLTERIIACANILPPHQAIYRDDEDIHEGLEVGLLLKLLPDQETSLRAAIAKYHPYDIPALLVWDAQTTTQFHEFLKTSFG